MTSVAAAADDQRVHILAPRGRDAAVVSHVLAANGLSPFVCASLAELVQALRHGAGQAFITEECLNGESLGDLIDWVARQPPWSDFPMVVLATRQAGRRPPEALATLEALGNVMLLERPLNAETLVSAARAGQRSRKRQYEARQQLEEQDRINQDNERLYQAESLALREAAHSREALLQSERLARADAEHASRMKDEFLATLSHELRTPLSAILGWVHLLRRRVPGAAELTKGIDTIERNARAQARLIEELLDMSRIIAGSVQLDRQPVMPAAVVESVISSMQPAVDAKSISLECTLDASAGPVSVDAHRLQQVVWNLLSNAVKFTPTGGRIVVEVNARDAEIEMTVRDSGEGIAADFLPFVFDRFRQADGSSTRKHGGLGLGLAIARQLVELQGGSVGVASDGLGLGATFAVRLPLEGTADEASAPAPFVARGCEPMAPRPAAATDALCGLSIVLVDDDADGREMIARLLSDQGARVRSTASADEAVAAIEAAQPDVLISDIGMPRVDGYQLIERLRRQGFERPAIALTAFARPEERGRALGAGFSAHMPKPVEPAELVSSVALLARRGVA